MHVIICQVVMRSFHMGMTTPARLQIPRGPLRERGLYNNVVQDFSPANTAHLKVRTTFKR